NEQELQYVIHWVNCCLILNNMVIQFEERQYGPSGDCLGPDRVTTQWAQNEHEEEGRGPEPPDGNGSLGDQTEYPSTGQNFRCRLMTLLFESPFTTVISHDNEQ
ncbi:hypothetical protein PAXRUDRAFT_177294, partial [Paxillus rubicundulus Ve08.2h10]